MKTHSRINELQSSLSHYRDTLKGEWEIPSQLIDYLNSNGYKKIGSGSFSDVYEKQGEKFILKLMLRAQNRDCYIPFVEFIGRHSNKHLPKVGRIRNYGNWSLIPIEKLSSLTHIDDEREDVKMIYAFNRAIKGNNKYHRERYDKLKIQFPELAKTLELLYSGMSNKCSFDLHRDNIMKRGNTIVFSDPFGYTKTFPRPITELKEPLAHYRTALRGSWSLPQELEKYLADSGYKLLGSGFFANVWAKPGERFVIKVGNNDTINDCYLDFLKFIQGKQSPHLPKIGRIRNYDGWYIIPIERLEPLHLPTNREDAQFVHAYWKCYKRFKKEEFCKQADEGKIKYPDLTEILEQIRDEFINTCGLDIGYTNMMLRGNTLVITDPLGGRLGPPR